MTSIGIQATVHEAPIARAMQDVARARLFASRYASAWLRKAQGQTSAEAASVATKATNARLVTLAKTEAADAFSTGRRTVDIVTSATLMRVWDATNDKRTCPVCSGADGTIVAYRESFPLGEPGSIHPNCACSWSLVTLEETRSVPDSRAA